MSSLHRSTYFLSSTPATRLCATAVAVLLGACLSTGVAYGQGIEFEPELVKVFETDSLYLHSGAEVSPSGRWMVFSGGPSLNEYSLFAIPSEGGEPRRLTEGYFFDLSPNWSPDGRYIYFTSDRVEGPMSGNSHVMRIPFDPASGTATDVPRAITLEPVSSFALSPDGEWVAYRKPGSGSPGGPPQIRVAPSAGGSSLTIAEGESAVGNVLGWTTDGSHVLYHRADAAYYKEHGIQRTQLWSVGRESGEAELLCVRDGLVVAYSRARDLVLWRSGFEPRANQTYAFTDLVGQVSATFSLPRRMHGAAGFGQDLTVSSNDSGVPLFLIPLSDGPLVSLAELGIDDVLGWFSPTRLLAKTEEGSAEFSYWDQEMTYFAYELGSPSLVELEALRGFKLGAEHISLPEEGSKALVYVAGLNMGGERGEGSYQLVDLESGARTTLFEAGGGEEGSVTAMVLTGRGGIRGRDGDAIFYLVWHEDYRDLYRVGPASVPEMVWRFDGPAESVYRRETPGVYGNRIAWIEAEEGEPVSGSGKVIMLGDLSTGEARELYRTEASFDQYVIWSNDGSKLALGFTGEDGRMNLGILSVTPSGEVEGELRVIDVGGLAWWGLRWLPDDEGLVLLAMGRTSAIDTDLLLFDLREGRDPGPRNLTDADPYSVWQFLLSPDGSQLVYGSERPMSAALHRMRLPELGGR